MNFWWPTGQKMKFSNKDFFSKCDPNELRLGFFFADLPQHFGIYNSWPLCSIFFFSWIRRWLEIICDLKSKVICLAHTRYGNTTQNATHRNIMYLYRGYSANISLGKGEEVDEERNKKQYRGAYSQKIDTPHINSSMYFFL